MLNLLSKSIQLPLFPLQEILRRCDSVGEIDWSISEFESWFIETFQVTEEALPVAFQMQPLAMDIGVGVSLAKEVSVPVGDIVESTQTIDWYNMWRICHKLIAEQFDDYDLGTLIEPCIWY